MLEKMSDFFEARLDGYDEHIMTNIESHRRAGACSRRNESLESKKLHRRAGACSRRNERFCFMQRRHQGTALQRGMGLPRAFVLQMRKRR